MPTHDIIDNREEVLLEHVKNLLRNSVSAKFAVGYFFTSGLAPLMNEVQNLKELKILIGNIPSKRTIEQLAEAHMNLKSEFTCSVDCIPKLIFLIIQKAIMIKAMP